MIDTHIHLDADQYADPASVIKGAREGGVRALIVPGTGPASNEAALALARRFPRFVYSAIGFHPERYDLTDRDFEATVASIKRERANICAIGEVGMPWYGDHAQDAAVRERAHARLVQLATLARDLDLPLILHAPHQSAGEALAIILEGGAARAVFHWHKSDDVTTRAILDAGYFISITPEVAFRDRDRALAQLIPQSRLLVETDGPWPHGGQFTGRATEPAMIRDTIAAIADLKGESFEAIRAQTTSNAVTLFGIAI